MNKKGLDELTAEELGVLFPVSLLEYDPVWNILFENEKKLIRNILPTETILNIYHIGSTSIPGMISKPTIDMLLEIHENADIENIKSKFREINYDINIRKSMPPPQIIFVKGYTLEGFNGQAYHVHVRYKGIHREIIFRDILRKNVPIRNEYEKLKLMLAEKYRNNRELYTDSKTEFIENAMNNAVRTE
jgi:GrpB-like predicted nucleotidyltransferase (UPF0157 family)